MTEQSQDDREPLFSLGWGAIALQALAVVILFTWGYFSTVPPALVLVSVLAYVGGGIVGGVVLLAGVKGDRGRIPGLIALILLGVAAVLFILLLATMHGG